MLIRKESTDVLKNTSYKVIVMKVAVLGSGNGGHAVAFEWARAGHDVYMYDFDDFTANIKAISENGGITAEGDMTGFQKIAYAGHDIEKVVCGAEIIFVVAPGNAAVPFAEKCKPFLKAGQIVVICPGSCFGSLEFKFELGMAIGDDDIIIAETSTLPYAARVAAPGKVTIPNRLKGGYYVAAVPSRDTAKVYEIMKKVYTNIEPAENIIKTSLQNANPVIHPAIMLSNLSKVDKKEKWEFYRDGVTAGVGRIIKAVDDDRVAIGKAYGAEIIPDPELGMTQGYMFNATYDVGYEKAPGFAGILAPTTTDHRYFNEDINGLCLWEEMAEYAGVSHHAITTVIDMASILNSKDFRAIKTKTMDSLGFSRYSLEELNKVL